MLTLSRQQRCDAYRAAFNKKKYLAGVPQVREDGRIYGFWMAGNNYKGSGYHGSFPPGFVKKIMSMFKDAESILHLFSGSLPAGDYIRFDSPKNVLGANADVWGDAHNLSEHFEDNKFDLIVADPPYTEEDAMKYGQPLVNRNTVIRECAKILQPGGFLCWMDMVYPMYRSKEWDVAGFISMIRSTNHRFRMVTLYERKDKEPVKPTTTFDLEF